MENHEDLKHYITDFLTTYPSVCSTDRAGLELALQHAYLAGFNVGAKEWKSLADNFQQELKTTMNNLKEAVEIAKAWKQKYDSLKKEIM